MRRAVLPLLAALILPGPGASAKEGPRAVISIAGGTLRLEPGGRGTRRVFPVATGRQGPGGQAGPVGAVRLGLDPKDPDFYMGSRSLPAFHRGMPFLRLDVPGHGSRPGLVYGLHGPVTPTLIWGQVSGGCVRMMPAHLRELFDVARRNPGMRVTFVRELDRVDGRPVAPDSLCEPVAGCPEAAVGARRLARILPGEVAHDRICGGVDHWYALETTGGDTISIRLGHDGGLAVELYGIRAISPVASGRFGLNHTLEPAWRSRGDRFIRVVAPPREAGGFDAYVLSVSVGATRVSPEDPRGALSARSAR